MNAIDGPVRQLLERIAGPAAQAVPDLEAIGAALTELAADTDYVTPWAERLGDRSGLLRILRPGAWTAADDRAPARGAPQRGPRPRDVGGPQSDQRPRDASATTTSPGGPDSRPEIAEVSVAGAQQRS